MKNIIITGASKGIGYATALELLNAGCCVIAVARSMDSLKKLKDESTSENIFLVEADITTSNGRIDILKVSQSLGRIDGLINNAALLINKPFLDLTIEEWINHFDLNLFSIVEIIKNLTPLFQRNAHILNIGSMGGYQGSVKFKGLSAYSASKSALANLTESLAIELEDREIRVNCLALGAVATEMQKNAFPDFKPAISANMMGNFVANFAIKDGLLFNGKVIPVALNNPS